MVGEVLRHEGSGAAASARRFPVLLLLGLLLGVFMRARVFVRFAFATRKRWARARLRGDRGGSRARGRKRGRGPAPGPGHRRPQCSLLRPGICICAEKRALRSAVPPGAGRRARSPRRARGGTGAKPSQRSARTLAACSRTDNTRGRHGQGHRRNPRRESIDLLDKHNAAEPDAARDYRETLAQEDDGEDSGDEGAFGTASSPRRDEPRPQSPGGGGGTTEADGDDEFGLDDAPEDADELFRAADGGAAAPARRRSRARGPPSCTCTSRGTASSRSSARTTRTA